MVYCLQIGLMVKKYLTSKAKRPQLASLTVVILGVAALGTYILLSSHAATPAAATAEAENGTKSGTTSAIADANASGGNALRFGTVAAGTGGYTVSGNKILNASGQQVTVHGVDRPTLEWDCAGESVTGGSGGIPASDFATMRNGWNANAVRIALNQDFWLSGANRYCASYQNTVDAAVQAARANNLIVILDLHWSDQGNLANSSPGQQCMADQNSITFWQQVATKYKNNPNVWFELYNEPENISWSIWLNGGSTCGFQAVGMQQLYNAVRGTGATNLVLAGGIGYASHLDGVTPLSGTNIVYAIHPYAADSSGGNADSWSTGDWDNRFGNLAATNPVIATEFGDKQCGSTYDQGILDYFRAHQVGYTAWAWFAGGCGFPSIITDAAGDCVNSMGCVIQQDMKKYP